MHVMDSKLKIHAKPIGWISILYIAALALCILFVTQIIIIIIIIYIYIHCFEHSATLLKANRICNRSGNLLGNSHQSSRIRNKITAEVVNYSRGSPMARTPFWFEDC